MAVEVSSLYVPLQSVLLWGGREGNVVCHASPGKVWWHGQYLACCDQLPVVLGFLVTRRPLLPAGGGQVFSLTR